MTGILIDGKSVSQEIRAEVKELTVKLNQESGVTPGLAFILVGNNPASEVYVRNKAKACESLGFYHVTEKMTEDVSQQKVIDKVVEFNNDERVHGILVQMPLPKHINEYDVIESIAPSKDVDALHPFNIGLYSEAKSWKEIMDKRLLLPCTPYGMMVLLEKYGIAVEGKKAVVVGRSNLGGKPTAALLLSKNATVTIAHSRTQDLKEVCRDADILVAVIGKANFIGKDFIKPGAAVLDVGINRTDAGLVGDVDFEAAKDVAGWITPVPGGVGAMTISMLMMNTYMAAARNDGGKSSKQVPATSNQKDKPFDLGQRSLLYARNVIKFLSTIPKTPANVENSKQLIRCSGAVGANYIEANDSLGKEDFLMRLRIARKEAKESRYWLDLLECPDSLNNERTSLADESTELLKILSVMIQKAE